ncbi:MAG: EI24 domain-containing protein [Planctomycetota bacterium]|nr:EI24 domain-containing protein [Planctomycetota bacterium]
MGSSDGVLRCPSCGRIVTAHGVCERCGDSESGEVPLPGVFTTRFVQGLICPVRALRYLYSPPGLGRYFMLPFVINVILFVVLLVGAVWAYDPLYDQFVSSTSTGFWAPFVRWAIFFVYLVAFTLVSIFLFNVVGTAIAAPFLDPLSHRVEVAALGDVEGGEIGRGLIGEFLFSAGQAIGMLFLSFSGLMLALALSFCLPVAGVPIALVLTSFITALEYLDVPLARKQYRLGEKLHFLWMNKASALGFGLTMQALLLVPLLNLLVLPAGAAGATTMFLDSPWKFRPSRR